MFTNIPRPPDGGAAGYDSLPLDAVAKNMLTIGSVTDLPGGWNPTGSDPQPSSFSAYGPTDDGRIKPDVCANGDQVYSAAHDNPNDQSDPLYWIESGSSMSTPGVTGPVRLDILAETSLISLDLSGDPATEPGKFWRIIKVL